MPRYSAKPDLLIKFDRVDCCTNEVKETYVATFAR